ncbi:T9SS type A sorting domain-containing protein [Chryseobacterium aahli]|uniref:lamin tail domain-containing protein n=1 Tax=Chryseobacterium aahli TaxID=1278643 RepID=UPI001F6162E0|nr:T9SS type A sorting domain-containing protein [Chryseobacterium aahli]MCI3937795.1 T9SS type A sorting domain-containing protein [Chryseobacterium aahli]
MKKVFTFIGLVSIAAFFNAQIVINEVYTGGGVLGIAVLTHDFIELKNIGSSTTTLNGATIQYGPATGGFTQYHTLPSITLSPGQTYLIQEGTKGGGVINLINPNLVVGVVVNFDGSPAVGIGLGIGLTSGKVALASNATQVTGPTASNVIDFVGYGLVNQYEGSGAAPSPTILNSITRTSGDTNNNAADFTVTLPSPSSSVLAVNDFNNTDKQSYFIKNTFVKNNEITFGADVKDIKVYNSTGQLVKTASVKEGAVLNVAELQKGNYIVTGTVNNQPISQKILKD